MMILLLNAAGMFMITLLFQYLLHRFKKNVFFSGPSVIFVICILGLLDGGSTYFASILGYMIADEIGNRVGWR